MGHFLLKCTVQETREAGGSAGRSAGPHTPVDFCFSGF